MIDLLVEMITKSAKPSDAILIMSNGGFNGIHNKNLENLKKQQLKDQLDEQTLI